MALLLFVFLIWAPAAHAWSRPAQGPVLQPFVYDEAHPYAAGQHRGVDLGAGAAGETVIAPAAGTVSFAGTVPTSGKSVTIETADGYSVTLTHLGSIAVAKGVTVAEQEAVGTVGPSGTPEVDGPYVHLGIRVTADPNGYVDPLSLLPPAVESGDDQGGSTATQPTSSGAAAAPPAKKPAPSAPPAKTLSPPARPHAGTGPAESGQRSSAAPEHGRAREPRPESRTNARSRHSSARARARERRAPREVARPRSRPAARTASLRRPFVEPVATEARAAAPAAQPRPDIDALVGLACNGAAALVAVAAALAASRRCRRARAIPVAGGQVLHLAPPAVVRRHVSRAA
jgi:hypothetical protein